MNSNLVALALSSAIAAGTVLVPAGAFAHGMVGVSGFHGGADWNTSGSSGPGASAGRTTLGDNHSSHDGRYRFGWRHRKSFLAQAPFLGPQVPPTPMVTKPLSIGPQVPPPVTVTLGPGPALPPPPPVAPPVFKPDRCCR
jgi:hypothetical protein